MVDSAFDIMQAASQIGLMFMGFVFVGVGLLMIAGEISKRRSGLKVKGRIAAVRATGVGVFDDEPQTSRREDLDSKKKAGAAGYTIALLFIALPLLFVGIGVWFAGEYLDLKNSGIPVQGVVTALEESTDSDGATSYSPVVTYTDLDGRAHTQKGRYSSGFDFFEQGDRVTVLYDAADPEHFIIDRFWYNMGLPVAFIGMGSIFLFVMFGAGRFKGRSYKGASRPRGKFTGEMYYPVYEYMTPDGRLVQAEAGGGDSYIGNKSPGTPVMLYLGKEDFELPWRPGLLLPLVGALFMMPGLISLHQAFTAFEVTAYTMVVALAAFAFFGFKISKKIKPRHMWDNKDSFRKRKKEEREEKQKTGRVLTESEFRERIKASDARTMRGIPVGCLVSMLMIAGGGYWFDHQKKYEQGALAAEGEVVRLEDSRDSDGTMYYPVVAFTDEQGRRHEFRDSVGSSHPSKRPGDKVKVLYPAEMPRRAMIDRGFWNLFPAAALFLVGLLGLLHALRLFAAIKSRNSRL